MLKNEYLNAKIGVDTAENELQKEWCVELVFSEKSRPSLHPGAEDVALRAGVAEVGLRGLGATPIG